MATINANIINWLASGPLLAEMAAQGTLDSMISSALKAEGLDGVAPISEDAAQTSEEAAAKALLKRIPSGMFSASRFEEGKYRAAKIHLGAMTHLNVPDVDTSFGVSGVLSAQGAAGIHSPSPLAAAASKSGPIKTSSADEENGIPSEPSAIEETKITPEEFVTLIEKEYENILERFHGVGDLITDAVRDAYLEELAVIEGKIQYWKKALQESHDQTGKLKEQYEEDVLIGARILLNRVLALGAAIFSEPIDEDSLAGVGLRTRKIRDAAKPQTPAPTSVPKPAPQEKGPKIIEALVNHDVGYGPELMLRPHQIVARNKLRGLLQMRQAQAVNGDKIPEELLRGTIVMPVGGGKTRTMVASFAVAIEEKVFDAARGDKLIILNHTDQIHGQNKEVAKRLGPYFEKVFGRPLKVTEYKAETKDLSGDIVIVSIPTVNTAERRKSFEEELRRMLGEQGRIAVTAVDEIHHLELGRGKSKESWREIIESLRKVSPNFYRVGFTATPTGREGPYIVRFRELDLMRAGVTPRTYLVKVEGEDLSQLKISQASGDFQTKELVSTLLAFPERNRRLYEELDRQGLRAEKKSPGGKENLEGVLGFAADLKHARMMAKDYAEYFGKAGNGNGLKGRNLELIGGERGKISAKDLRGMLEKYRRGGVDGVVAIVSGETGADIRSDILKAVEHGEIEAVFNVDVWLEGADLYMFTHLLGARPTFSSYKKAQERGRLNRRGPKEVNPNGELLSDKPKILFDVIDEYHGFERQLMQYGTLMGLSGHTKVVSGELFDAMHEKSVANVDAIGGEVAHETLEDLLGKKRPVTKPKELPLTPLTEKLWEVLEGSYLGDVENMAIDLGVSVEEMESILNGQGWVNRRWFLRRLATLVYQDRDCLVDIYNEERDLGDEKVSDADVAILHGALAVYEELEGHPPTAELIFEKTLKRFYQGAMGERQWRRMWQSLYVYFDGKPEIQRAIEQKEKMEAHLFAREGWTTEAHTAKEALLLTARKYVALRWGGVIPALTGIQGIEYQGPDGFLTRWVGGETFEYSPKSTPSSFYSKIKSLLVGLGMNEEKAGEIIEEAVFEERGWSKKTHKPREKLLHTARSLIAFKWGGVMPINTGLQGVSEQKLKHPLSRWVKGENLEYSTTLTHSFFYTQVKLLLIGLEMQKEEVKEMIQAAVFEEQGWSQENHTAREKLLYTARRLIASQWGGVMPNHIGIQGISIQGPKAPLTCWVRGENLVFASRFTPSFFYAQVKLLLIGLGMQKEEATEMIRAVVFEEQRWPTETHTEREKLLFTARGLIALKWGGVMPGHTGIQGVSSSSRAPLARWVGGESLKFSKSLTPAFFCNQIKLLLIGLGMNEKKVEEMIEAAIFEEQGWSQETHTAREKLLYTARGLIALKWGGVMPINTGLQGVSKQNPKHPLSRWVKGENLEYSNVFTHSFFYTKVKLLLIGLGMQKEEATEMIQAAVFEEQGWSQETHTAREKLLYTARGLIALKWGGVMPHHTDIQGVPSQSQSKGLLNNFLRGKNLSLTPSLISQIHALLVHDGTLSAREADKLIGAV